MEIFCEVVGTVLEVIVEVIAEAVCGDGESLWNDLNAIEKGNRRPGWRIEKYVC